MADKESWHGNNEFARVDDEFEGTDHEFSAFDNEFFGVNDDFAAIRDEFPCGDDELAGFGDEFLDDHHEISGGDDRFSGGRLGCGIRDFGFEREFAVFFSRKAGMRRQLGQPFPVHGRATVRRNVFRLEK